ncbi:MAG: hypothetical protein HC790_10040 [Acaryochloridaceae cyanobacterium CSU_3_4]|nr:hypothetical protein [Acaryochloridaceae cyanobacterium CSU_3_4]
MGFIGSHTVVELIAATTTNREAVVNMVKALSNEQKVLMPVTNSGYGGRTVTVDVEDEGRIVGSEQVRLPNDGSPATVRVRAAASSGGIVNGRFIVNNDHLPCLELMASLCTHLRAKSILIADINLFSEKQFFIPELQGTV